MHLARCRENIFHRKRMVKSAVEREKAVTTYFSSKRLQLFGFAQRDPCDSMTHQHDQGGERSTGIALFFSKSTNYSLNLCWINV